MEGYNAGSIGYGSTAIIVKKRVVCQWYAVKRYRAATCWCALQEFKMGKGLEHKNIIKTHVLVLGDLCPEMYMELCNEDLLSFICRHGALDAAHIRRYLRGLLEGIEYLHKVGGIAHCDIKPENLLLDFRDELKIADFGSCSIVEAGKIQGVHGTLPYMAPEQFAVERYEPMPTDMWACGIVLYCMLNAKLPWGSAQSSDEGYAYCKQAPHNEKASVLLGPGQEDYVDIINILLNPLPLWRGDSAEALRAIAQMSHLSEKPSVT